MLKKVLKYLCIIQEVSNKNRTKKIGRGFTTAIRFNPYNPLSYITLAVIIIIGVLMFGFVGFWKEVDRKTPFKWN